MNYSKEESWVEGILVMFMNGMFNIHIHINIHINVLAYIADKNVQ